MMRPLGARALVKRLEAPKTESSLIEIPDTVDQGLSPYAIVLAVGKLVNGGFDAGDTVVLSHYSGAPCRVELDGDVFDALVVTEDQVLAVVEGL